MTDVVDNIWVKLLKLPQESWPEEIKTKLQNIVRLAMRINFRKRFPYAWIEV